MADRLPRLYAAQIPEAGHEVSLAAPEVRHARVLRLRQGARIVLFDAEGVQAESFVNEVSSSTLRCLVHTRSSCPKPNQRLTLLVGMTKGDKPDLVVRMATELGVSALRFVTCKRSVVVDHGRSDRFDRLRHIAREACAQSGNAYAPLIVEPKPLLQVAAEAPEHAARLVFWERAHLPMPALEQQVSDVWAIVGPEGGLDTQEVEHLSSLGYVSVALGTPILRAETAAIAIAARITERFGPF